MKSSGRCCGKGISRKGAKPNRKEQRPELFTGYLARSAAWLRAGKSAAYNRPHVWLFQSAPRNFSIAKLEIGDVDEKTALRAAPAG
ncbi:MAG: hypothetical protein LC742_00780, partial [Acidobacteria bacterium]|nr:hypothetical protein [Acidobacteriota bacterium]